MAIPFIQKLPDGRRIAIAIKRDTDTENLAQDFIDAGGRYLVEMIPPNKVPETPDDPAGMPRVHIMAIIDTKSGQAEKVAEDTVPNGPELPKAIDRLVQASHHHLPPFEMVRRTRLVNPRGEPLVAANSP